MYNFSSVFHVYTKSHTAILHCAKIGLKNTMLLNSCAKSNSDRNSYTVGIIAA